MIDEIERLIEKETKEKPHTVRFFTVPDFLNLGFKLYPIAKISNNGSTFVFSDEKDIFEYLNMKNGYNISIEKVN